jgi:hypothetical protein
MFCSHCGKEIPNDAVICVGCGRAVKPIQIIGNKWSGGMMAFLIIATILIPLVGIIAGIIGLTQDAKRGQGGLLLAVGIIMFVFWFAVILLPDVPPNNW